MVTNSSQKIFSSVFRGSIGSLVGISPKLQSETLIHLQQWPHVSEPFTRKNRSVKRISAKSSPVFYTISENIPSICALRYKHIFELNKSSSQFKQRLCKSFLEDNERLWVLPVFFPAVQDNTPRSHAFTEKNKVLLSAYSGGNMLDAKYEGSKIGVFISQ